MERLGVLGGIGPESTIAYYRAIIATGRQRGPAGGYPPVLINSIDLQKTLQLVADNALTTLTDYLACEVDVLAKGGAALGLIAANTPHIVFNEVLERAPIPLVSIVDATCGAARALRLNRVGLFGTRFTMQGRFYPDVFSRAGIDVVAPGEEEQAYIHDKYMTELVNGVFLRGTRDGLLRIVELLKDRDRIEAVILAGTELPLILTDSTASGIPLLDTTQIHVQAATSRLWG
jgi:aspartate racemase